MVPAWGTNNQGIKSPIGAFYPMLNLECVLIMGFVKRSIKYSSRNIGVFKYKADMASQRQRMPIVSSQETRKAPVVHEAFSLPHLSLMVSTVVF